MSCHAISGHAYQLLRARGRIHSSRPGSGIAITRNGDESQTITRLHKFIELPDEISSTDFPRRQWKHSTASDQVKECGLKYLVECVCGHPEQTVHHIIEDSPLYQPPNGEQGLATLDDDTRLWLISTKLEI